MRILINVVLDSGDADDDSVNDVGDKLMPAASVMASALGVDLGGVKLHVLQPDETWPV